MIKQGIINFFKNLKYFFTPLGTLALGLISGLSVLIPGVISSFSAFAENVQKILSDTSIDFNVLKDSAISAVQTLDWSNPLNAIKTMLNSDWLMDTLNGCVGAFVENTEVYTAQFSTAINAFTHDLTTYFASVIVFLIFGLIGGFFLTKWLIRRNIARRNLWKYFLNSFIDSLLTATLVAVCAWLITVWKPSILISAIISVLLFGFISLFEAYVIHAWKKVDVKQIVNAKNIFKLFATNIIIFLLSGVMVLLAIAITNVIAGIVIGIELMEIAFIVIGLNAEAYVKSVGESTNNQAAGCKADKRSGHIKKRRK